MRNHNHCVGVYSKTDLRAYFRCRATDFYGGAAKKKNPNPEIIASTTEYINRVEIEMVKDEVEKSTLVKVTTIYQNIFISRLGNIP